MYFKISLKILNINWKFENIRAYFKVILNQDQPFKATTSLTLSPIIFFSIVSIPFLRV